MMSSDGKSKSAALLWDESFLWGVMAHKALHACGLSFDLLRAADVKSGKLTGYGMLIVPGGWASNKLKALGGDGAEAIRLFVHNGGSYLGFCGGAGLATLDGIGLLPIKRKPTQERVPSFSGRIRLTLSDHPLWQEILDPIFHAWWPSQFMVDGSVNVLASYADALSDSFSSDVNVGDAVAASAWADLERIYGINLDPKRLLGEPAVVEGMFGKGRVLLSLVHFDTPGDRNGSVMLRNIGGYAGLATALNPGDAPVHKEKQRYSNSLLQELEAAANELIDIGMRNFLWFRRNSMLLQWRRGVRGLEYASLQVMVNEVSALMREKSTEDNPDTGLRLERIRERLVLFMDLAKRLLPLERFAMQKGHITFEQCDDLEIQAIRDRMFSRTKSHGGLFKELIDEIDALLYLLMHQHTGTGCVIQS